MRGDNLTVSDEAFSSGPVLYLDMKKGGNNWVSYRRRHA